MESLKISYLLIIGPEKRGNAKKGKRMDYLKSDAAKKIFGAMGSKFKRKKEEETEVESPKGSSATSLAKDMIGRIFGGGNAAEEATGFAERMSGKTKKKK